MCGFGDPNHCDEFKLKLKVSVKQDCTTADTKSMTFLINCLLPLLKSLECETNLDKMCTLPKKDDTINGQWNCYHPDECPEEELDSG